MEVSDQIRVALSKPVCLKGISEDVLRQLVQALEIELKDPDFPGLVTTSAGVEVKFTFGPDGSFQGVTAKINGQHVVLIPGSASQLLQVFKGPPTGVNPGPGWELEPELTKLYLGGSDDQNTWQIFYARRVSILNVL